MQEAYAQALWKMVEGGLTPAKAVRALQETLKVHGREALLPRIASAFARIAQRETKRSDVVLTLAREKDGRHAHKDIKGMVTRMKVDSKDLKTQIDDTLIGGWRLEGREMLTDVSYKKALLDLYARVTS